MRHSNIMRGRRAGLILLATTAAVALALTGCSSPSSSTTATASAVAGSDLAKTCLPDATTSSLPKDWEKTVAAARTEGAVTLYTVQPPALTSAMVAGFTQDCPGIHVNVVQTDNTSLLTRFNAELQSTGKPQADLLETSDAYLESKNHPTAFRQASTALVPSLSDYPKTAIQGKAWVDFAYLWGVIYNTNTVKGSDIPKTWKDVANSKFAGKITGADPRASTSFQSFYLFMQKTYGDGWLTTMKGLNEKYTATTLPAAQAVAAGQYELALPAANSHIAALRLQGAPVAIAFPTPSQINAGFLAVTNGGPHPNAARVLAAFYASKTGQEIQCNAGALSSLNSTVGGACAGIALPTGLSIANTAPDPTAVASMAATLGLH